MAPNPVLAKAMTEEELLVAIIEAAQYRSWLVHHVRRSDKALQMGHPGFPDLVLARNGQVYFLELKELGKYADAAQVAWIDAINGPVAPLPIARCQAWQINTSQLDEVLEWLR